MGELGTGSLTKLVNHLLTFVHGAAAAEALAFAERTGLDLAAVGEVMKVSFGQSKMLELPSAECSPLTSKLGRRFGSMPRTLA